MNICFITYMYPGKHNTSDFAFVKQLVDAISELGHHCHVIAPFNITHYRRLSRTIDYYKQGQGDVTVYRPGYLSFSNWHIGCFYPTAIFRKYALKKSFQMLKLQPDVIYGHFWDSGYQGYKYARKYNIPLFVATGESEVAKLFSYKKDQREFGEYVSGVICVSSKNRDESINLGLTIKEKCAIFPNAVNSALFKKMDKKKCRELLGFPQDVFIVAFLGWFTERKGPKRVERAINSIEGRSVYSIFIGKGDQDPICNNILFKGTLQHEQVPTYLNTADVFVLPTLHEGCCNAVVEALSCGLPVISSDLPFNWDVLNENNSILVDPNDTNSIAEAIRRLRDNDILREKMSESALQSAQSLDINNRARKIMDFITSKIQ